MKKFIRMAAAIAVAATTLVGCDNGQGTKDKGYELAVVTDVGQLMDGGFNQGTYEGVKTYAEANKITYNYYAPANGADATDADRIAAMEQAVTNGAKVIVTPGFLQATALTTVAKEYPDVKFVFVDGWAMGIANVTAIVYKEQESGYLAGYAAVKDGYTKLGGTFGGGGSNPACNRFAYGYVQGAAAAAKEAGITVDCNISFKYGSGFSASSELQTQISQWYNQGTQVVFSCGGSMVNSVISAANETKDGMVIGVDTDQSVLSERVLTSAVKGLSESVQLVLKEYYAGEWNSKLSDKASNLGAAENATGLPTADKSWKFKTFTKKQYEDLYANIKNGTIVPASDVAENCDNAEWWADKAAKLGSIKINFE